ncbi:hypothetical protein FOHLNKBM_6364 [Methylobacterium longum]|nr:hypothetical protein FOHLNKBM_6364 [Methylobacterium longum]
MPQTRWLSGSNAGLPRPVKVARACEAVAEAWLLLGRDPHRKMQRAVHLLAPVEDLGIFIEPVQLRSVLGRQDHREG